jgi:hypothetical protein
MMVALVRTGELALGGALGGGSEEVLSQVLLYIGVLATAGALGGALWLALAPAWAVWKRGRVLERRRFEGILAEAAAPASDLLGEAPFEPPDRCDLYGDLGDTAPTVEIEEPTETSVAPLPHAPATLPTSRMNELSRAAVQVDEEDFFDGDTKVELGSMTASA